MHHPLTTSLGSVSTAIASHPDNEQEQEPTQNIRRGATTRDIKRGTMSFIRPQHHKLPL